MASVFRDGEVDFTQQLEELLPTLIKEGRKEINYEMAYFEWTHFKANADGHWLLVLIVLIINRLTLGNNESFDA